MVLFIELVQISLGARTCLSKVPSESEWQDIYQMAEKQALLGLLFSAIEKLNEKEKSFMPPMPLFYQWMGIVLNTESRNKRLNDAADQLTRVFKNGGLRSCVLKGQGIARLYPQPFRRQPGDIDLWVEGKRDEIVQWLRDNNIKTGGVVYHHVDADFFDDVNVEIHFIPGWVYHPVINHKLQRFYRECASRQFNNIDKSVGFAYPTCEFNSVYILAHIYMHFLFEGIGLRQFIDYYYVLIDLPEDKRNDARNQIVRVGLEKFAKAVMYVLQVVTGIQEEYLLFEPNEKKGKQLLEEILYSGNFGQYDTRFHRTTNETMLRQNTRLLKRQLKLLNSYPIDVITVPFWKIVHYIWRKYKGYL